MSRANVQPILEAIPAARQQDARHYGVHPYFTRRPSNVVRAYVERYSREDDVVLDPFGGTGVTAIEAMLLGRRAIHNDLNPFANFIAQNIADTTLASTLPLHEAMARVAKACSEPLREIERDEKAAARWLKRLPLPENIALPRNSDAEHFYDMFTPRQLAGLALLKATINDQSDGVTRNLLLLAWSAAIAKLNKTFLSAKGRAASRGGSSIFSIYRYKLAKQCVELPIWETFKGRVNNVVAAKEEILASCAYSRLRGNHSRQIDSRRDFRVVSEDAACLPGTLGEGTVDYIFTDPPYGAFISYLDLSILWNHWLGLPVTEQAREQETIVGGEKNHTEQHYKDGLARSIQACFQLLRGDRWCSIVFQHWDTSYFATILDTADECGAEPKTAITQTGDVIWSMHKKKNSASVLAGEMILTFYKPAKAKRPRPRRADAGSTNPADAITSIFDTCLGNGTTRFTSEALFNRLVMEMWRRHALGCLSLSREEFAAQLKSRGWSYDTHTHQWVRTTDIGQTPAQHLLF